MFFPVKIVYTDNILVRRSIVFSLIRTYYCPRGLRECNFTEFHRATYHNYIIIWSICSYTILWTLLEKNTIFYTSENGHFWYLYNVNMGIWLNIYMYINILWGTRSDAHATRRRQVVGVFIYFVPRARGHSRRRHRQSGASHTCPIFYTSDGPHCTRTYSVSL